MHHKPNRLAWLAGLALSLGVVGAASARVVPDTVPARPIFTYLTHPGAAAAKAPAAALPSWVFSYTYKNTNYSETLIGNAPTGSATTIPVYIIPIQLTYGSTTFSALQTTSNGQTAVGSTTNSPMFQSVVDFNQGGTDLGTTQYIDAFERGNLWYDVASNPGYHVLLGSPTIEALQKLKVPSNKGRVATEFGVKVITADINWFDTQVNKIITNLHIPSNALPIFVTYETYLTQSGGCCIGGYHSYNGTTTYAHFTYIGTAGVFSQDVSALSHEIGEWINDPYVNNNTPCGILETGDPLENEANYGDYAYTANGFTYHLQDLTYLPYFGAPTSTSVHGWTTFQNAGLAVCQNGS